MHRTSGLSSSSCCFSSFEPDGYFSNDLKTSVRPSNEVVLLNAAKQTQTTQRSHNMHNCNTRRCRTSRTASATAKRTPPPLLTDVFPTSRVRQTHHKQIVPCQPRIQWMNLRVVTLYIMEILDFHQQHQEYAPTSNVADNHNLKSQHDVDFKECMKLQAKLQTPKTGRHSEFGVNVRDSSLAASS